MSITRPCCAITAEDFDRATGSVRLPHKISARVCARWFSRRRTA